MLERLDVVAVIVQNILRHFLLGKYLHDDVVLDKVWTKGFHVLASRVVVQNKANLVHNVLYAVGEGMARKILRIELILHADHVATLFDRCQRILGTLLNFVFRDADSQFVNGVLLALSAPSTSMASAVDPAITSFQKPS